MPDRLMPSVFVSHGAPTIVDADSPMRPVFASIGATLGKPRGIVCISAHWGASKPAVQATPNPDTIHDFRGFQEELYTLKYPAPGAPGLAVHVRELLADIDLDCAMNQNRGLDHGAWVPLIMMYPEADIPVTQLAIQTDQGPAHHYQLGQALRGLREEGILILGSGSAVHNLQHFVRDGTEVPDWAQSFEDWLVTAVLGCDNEALISYRTTHPAAEQAHPTEEHLLPLHVAMGAGSDGGQCHMLHRGFMDGALSMAAFAFE